jgi:hypothetical protein
VSQPHQSPPELIVLHTLRCIGHAGRERVARASGRTETEVENQLDRLRARGMVTLDEGVFGGWGLTASGRDWAEAAVRREAREANAPELVKAEYQKFLPLNGTVMSICHDWQMRSLGGRPVLNDHDDHRYDDAVLARLSAADQTAQAICERLASQLARYGVYGSRLSHAIQSAYDGDVQYVTDDLESYHSVWFQLHEDLLVTCGITRDEERARQL